MQNRHNWESVIRDLTTQLERIRSKWYEECLEFVRRPPAAGLSITHTDLGGDGEAAINAFQLLYVSGVLASHRYIGEEDGQDFADMLYSMVGAPSLQECLHYCRRYREALPDEKQAWVRFSLDVAQYIVGVENSLIGSLCIFANIGRLILLTEYAVARVFGDRQGAEQVAMKIRKLSISGLDSGAE